MDTSVVIAILTVSIILISIQFYLIMRKNTVLAKTSENEIKLNSELRETKAALRQKEHEDAQLKESINTYKQKLQQSRKKAHELKAEISDIKNDWTEDKEILQEKESEISRIHKAIDNLKEEIRTLQKEKDVLVKKSSKSIEKDTAPSTNSMTEQRLSSLERELQLAKDDFDKSSKDRSEMKHTIKKLERRIEDYRKIDIITKNKFSLLEDKLATLGRRYYDAVSELAQLKGQSDTVADEEMDSILAEKSLAKQLIETSEETTT